MKLATLLEYQRCFKLLRACEQKGASLTGNELVTLIEAYSKFDFELAQVVGAIEVEVEQ